MSHIFISYSRKDSETAKEIVNSLRGVGFVVWQDVSTIRSGENWLRAIEKGIDQADCVIVLVSTHSKASTWVNKEIDRAIIGDKQIIPITLEPKIELSSVLQSYNALSMNNLKQLLSDLPATARRVRQGFDRKVALQDHDVRDEDKWTIDDSHLVSVPLFESSYCKAAVIGEADTIVDDPTALYLCLQFSRDADKTFVTDVFQYVQSKQEEATASDEPTVPPFIAVQIAGPTDALGRSHKFDNANAAHWTDALDTTLEAINEVRGNRYPHLHVFIQGPGALAFALGTKFWRFWNLHIYNFVGGEGVNKYARVTQISADNQ